MSTDDGLFRPVRRLEAGTYFDNENRPVPSVPPEVYADKDGGAPDWESAFSPIQIAVVKIALGLDPRPIAEIAAELKTTQQNLSAMADRVRVRLGFRRTRKRRTSPAAA